MNPPVRGIYPTGLFLRLSLRSNFFQAGPWPEVEAEVEVEFFKDEEVDPLTDSDEAPPACTFLPKLDVRPETSTDALPATEPGLELAEPLLAVDIAEMGLVAAAVDDVVGPVLG